MVQLKISLKEEEGMFAFQCSLWNSELIRTLNQYSVQFHYQLSEFGFFIQSDYFPPSSIQRFLNILLLQSDQNISGGLWSLDLLLSTRFINLLGFWQILTKRSCMLKLPHSDQPIKVFGMRRNKTEYIICFECVTKTDKTTRRWNMKLQLEKICYNV